MSIEDDESSGRPCSSWNWEKCSKYPSIGDIRLPFVTGAFYKYVLHQLLKLMPDVMPDLLNSRLVHLARQRTGSKVDNLLVQKFSTCKEDYVYEPSTLLIRSDPTDYFVSYKLKMRMKWERYESIGDIEADVKSELDNVGVEMLDNIFRYSKIVCEPVHLFQALY